MTDRDLPALLARWDAAVLARAREHELPDVPTTALRPAATEREVRRLEERIGVALPPSYRRFLLHSDGALAQPGWNSLVPGVGDDAPIGLWPAEQVAWLRETAPDLVDAWGAASDFELALTEDEYADYDRDQDPVQIKVAHLPHLLQVSCSIDGYFVALNPLVVNDGEWEAWDFGNKLPGALRYPSFRALMEASLGELETPEPPPPPIEPSELDAAFARLLAGELEPYGPELGEVRGCPDPAERLDDLVTLSGPTYQPLVRQAALAALARVPGTRALDAILAATAGDSPVWFRSVTVARLAEDPDPRARPEAVRLLTDGESAAFVRDTSVVWEAWEASRNPALIRRLLDRGDERAKPLRLAALVDPGTPSDVRALLCYSTSSLPEPALVPAVLTAYRYGGVPTTRAVRGLMFLHAWDEAMSLITPEVLADPNNLPELLLDHVVEIARDGGQVAAMRLLVDRFRESPTAAGAKLLGSLVHSDAVTALEEAAGAARLAQACVRALERSAGPGAVQALERLAGSDGPARELAAAALAVRERAPGSRPGR